MTTPVDQVNAAMFGTCPVPQSRYEHILLGHGSGGQLTAELIGRLFVPAFDNEVLSALEDQATLSLDCGLRIADCGSKEKTAIRNPQSPIKNAFNTHSFL